MLNLEYFCSDWRSDCREHANLLNQPFPPFYLWHVIAKIHVDLKFQGLFTRLKYFKLDNIESICMQHVKCLWQDGKHCVKRRICWYAEFSHILVETLILHYFARETNSLTVLINPTRSCFMQTTGKSLLIPNVCTKWTVPKLRTVPGIKQTWDVTICKPKALTPTTDTTIFLTLYQTTNF